MALLGELSCRPGHSMLSRGRRPIQLDQTEHVGGASIHWVALFTVKEGPPTKWELPAVALLMCRGVVVPAPGAAAGGVRAERCVGRAHLRHLLLCLAQPAPRSGREPPLTCVALPCCCIITQKLYVRCTGSTDFPVKDLYAKLKIRAACILYC